MENRNVDECVIEGVCFDLDGTLFDDRQYVRAGLTAAARHLEQTTGVDVTSDLLEEYFRRGNRERTFDAVLADRGLPTESVPTLIDEYHSNSASLVPYSDAERTLRRLVADHRLAVVTGGRNGASKLDRLGLREYFDVVTVVTGRDVSKRDPRPLEKTLAELDVEPSRSAFIGDRPAIDFEQPNRLGMLTVRVLRGQYATVDTSEETEPDAVVGTLSEIPNVLREQGSDHCSR